MTERENLLRTIEFRGPEWIPCSVGFSPATWNRYREDLEDLILRHPLIFGRYEKGKRDFDDFPNTYREGQAYTDNWGCIWENVQGGLEGIITKHPLVDYSALEHYRAPDPLTKTERGERENWEDLARRVQIAKDEGRVVWLGGDRFFERLHFLRGFENLMADFALNPPEVKRLIDLVLEHNMTLVRRCVGLAPDVVGFGDDLGTQTAPMMSPQHFAQHLAPGYRQQFQAARQAGAHVYFHCDGHILELIPQLMDCGVSVLNPQVGANGMDALAELCRGRLCLNLDLDRQGVLPFGTTKEVRDHVREAVSKLGTRQGGLMLYAECQPNVPLENTEAACRAMEEVRQLG